MPKVDPVRAAARRYAERGLPVIPVRGKKPIGEGWGDAPPSPDELDAILSERPGLGVALPLNGTDLIDVECDTPEADAAFIAMCGGNVPPTPTWDSKRGPHRLFRRPADCPPKSVAKADGIEFRLGANGKATASVLPPSPHPDGGTYRWREGLSFDDVEPAELPPAVVAAIGKVGNGATRATLATATDGRIPEGERNDTLFRLACQLREAKLGPEGVEAALLAENAAHCDPPLPDDEVRAIARSASKRSASGPREAAVEAAGECEFWRSPDGTGYATLPVDGHREHVPVESRAFRDYLAHAA